MNPVIMFLCIWAVVWIVSLSIAIWYLNRHSDITITDFLQGAVVTLVLGPIVPFGMFLDDLARKGFFKRVMFKKSTKRTVWEALGGDEKNGP